MPFGKYQGQRLSEIEDTNYLDWLLGQIENDAEKVDLKNALLFELNKRPEWHSSKWED